MILSTRQRRICIESDETRRLLARPAAGLEGDAAETLLLDRCKVIIEIKARKRARHDPCDAFWIMLHDNVPIAGTRVGTISGKLEGARAATGVERLFLASDGDVHVFP